MAHVRDKPPLRESTEIVTPSGKRYRWAADESRAENVPRDERWSDVIPGGFETFDATLPRKPAVDYADLERLSRVTRYDASGGVIWQGRLERAPRVSGDQIAVSPSAVGYQAHLEDDKSVQVVFVDRDLSAWQGPSVQRRLDLIAAGRPPRDNSGVAPDDTTGVPAVTTTLSAPWDAGSAVEAWYDAGAGANVGLLRGDANNGSNVSFGDVQWAIRALVVTTDTAASVADNIDVRALGAGANFTADAGAVSTRYALVQMYYGLAYSADDKEYRVNWKHLRAFGNHDLTLRGDIPNEGLYDGDVIGYALSRWCPQLAYTNETLVSDTFVIPQLAFKEPTTVGEIVKQATRFHLRDWAVWEGPMFWLQDRGARGNRWRAPVGPTQLEETGPQVDRLWNSIIVAYQDVDGSTRTVGPTGSDADTESAYLLDDDPENPANKTGITRRDLLTMGVSTSAGAIEVGRRFLEQTKRLDSSGRARIVGHVQDDKGVWRPYSHVRAGDMISFTDAADTSERRIVKTDKSRSDRSCSIDLDAPPEALQALLERLGVVLVPLGL